MTILDIMSGKPITGVLTRGERGRTFVRLTSRLSVTEIQAIRQELDTRISGKNIHTSSWMPGRTWQGTPFQPIYDKAAQQDYTTSALMFGLLVWEAFERHPEDWYTGKFEKDGVEIGGRTYFQPEE